MQLRAAHGAMTKARNAYEDWYRDVIAHKRPFNRADGLRLADQLHKQMRTYLAFLEAE